jgi:hypothetical protein
MMVMAPSSARLVLVLVLLVGNWLVHSPLQKAEWESLASKPG